MATNVGNPEDHTYKRFRAEDPDAHDVVNSDADDDYAPAEDEEEVVDLYNYLKGLETAETDLDGPHDPPALFTQPEHKHNYKNISILRYEASEEQIDDYVKEFDDNVDDDLLHVGSITVEEIQEEERRLRDEHIAFQEQELSRAKKHQQDLLRIQDDAKKRVAQDLREKRRQLARKIEIAKQRERLQLDALHKSFKRCESRLTTNLTRRAADVKTMYGDLSLADGEYGGAKGRRWTLDWVKTPQPVQIKLKCLRGVKDKLPGGRYVLMVSLYDRMGGSVLKWSQLKGQQWGGATLPIVHSGNFYDVEMAINQSVFVVLPPHVSLKPSMVIVFELFLLRGSVVQTDRVVCWGCFPICDNNLDVVEGLYKAPFLRGEIDTKIDRSTKVEKLISSDLDHWMCNLYFEIIRLPRYVAGQKEFEVELLFTPDMLSDPDKLKEMTSLYTEKTPSQYKEGDDSIRSSTNSIRQDPVNPVLPQASHLNMSVTSRAGRSSSTLHSSNSRDVTAELTMASEHRKRPMTTYGSRFAKSEHHVHLDDSSSSESEIDDMQIVDMKNKNEEAFKPVRGVPSLSYKRYLNHTGDMYGKKVYTLLPRSAVLKKKRENRNLSYHQKLKKHTASVKKEYKVEKGETRRQAEHVRRQMLSELSLTVPASRAFWTMVLMFVITFFIRIYIHYVGQWLLLTALTVPINSFTFLPYTVKVLYHNTLLHAAEEIAVVVVGPLSVFVAFLLAVCLCYISQKAFTSFPDVGHKFTVCLGIQAFFDPIFIAAIDGIIGSWDYNNLGSDQPLADFSKVYWHFVRTEGTGFGGAFITVLIYAYTMFVSGSLLYMYFLRLHNNGRMLDVYWRLHSSEKAMFVPYDLEISFPELDSICKKAEQWRGEEGERRKTSVYAYEWSEEYVDSDGKNVIKKEKTTHISIHTVHLDGLRELYRHFLVGPDGAVLEVFAEKMTDLERAQQLQQRRDSVQSVHPVKGRLTVFTRAGFIDDESLHSRRQSIFSTTSKSSAKTAWSGKDKDQ